MKAKPEWWYEKKLLQHFNLYYYEFEDVIEWYVNPGPHTWKFYIPGPDFTVVLKCDGNGKITEKRTLGADS